jgi:hypothetical protein
VIDTGTTEPSYREEGNQWQCSAIDELTKPKCQEEAYHSWRKSHQELTAPLAPVLGHRRHEQQVKNVDVVPFPGQVEEEIPIELCGWGTYALRACCRRIPSKTVAVESPPGKLPGAAHIEVAALKACILAVRSPGKSLQPVYVLGIPARKWDRFLVQA